MGDKAPRISDAEWKLMKVLWAAKEAMPAYDIIQAVADIVKWQDKTVRTMLNRLVKKGALDYRRYKNLYLYYPKVTEEESVRAEGKSFLDRCFNGRIEPLLAHFAGYRKLSRAQVKELERILNLREE
jgi:BlaI family transcriptional regulator, penicillinase repressor